MGPALASIARFVSRRLSPRVTRSMEAAGVGRRWEGVRDTPSQLSALHGGRRAAMLRSRSLSLNNALYASGINVWEYGLVGSGIKAQSAHTDAVVRERLGTAFERWTDEADADGRTDFYGLQALIARQVVRDGEAFVVMDVTEAGRLRLRVHDAEMVDDSLTRDLGNGRAIVQGIELDASGRQVAYHFRRSNPGLPFVADLSTVRLDASRVLHIFRRDTAGQLRGVPWGAQVMLRLADYDAAMDAHLVRFKTSGLLTGFVINPEGVADPMGGPSSTPGVVEVSLEPGEMKVLLPGQDVRFSDPAKIGAESIDFLRLTRTEIAAGFGIPAHLLDGDLTEANYSSLRAGLVEFRRRVEALQHGVFAFQLLRPVWRRWATLEVLSGRIDASGFTRDPEPWLAATFIPPRVDWVDPQKDVEAEIAAIGASLMSRRQAVAARGLDVETLDREIAADRQREASLGLSPPNRVPTTQEPTP